jgi:cell division protein FtsZ
MLDLPNGSWLNGLWRGVRSRPISNVRPKVLVIGVGGAGGNALNNMIRGELRGVEFCAVNTDVQALEQSLARRRLQIGPRATRGLGAGARVGIGQVAAEESLETIKSLVRGNDIVFVTAGMGGGTGTGAAPIIAGLARRSGVLTIGVVTKPFDFEGEHRQHLAQGGVAEMEAATDTLLVIPNQNLFQVADAQTTLLDAFRMADEVLHAGVRGVTDLMAVPGLVNLDFADVRTVMADMGQATMGTGEAAGEDRAAIAAAAAMSNPLIEQGSMSGARGVLINVTGGADLTLFDVNAAVERVRREAAPTANIIFGSTFNKKLHGRIRISIVATGIGAAEIRDACWPVGEIIDPKTAYHSVPAASVPNGGLPMGDRFDKRRGLAAGLAVMALLGGGALTLVHGGGDRPPVASLDGGPSGNRFPDVPIETSADDASAAVSIGSRGSNEPIPAAWAEAIDSAASLSSRTMADAPDIAPPPPGPKPRARPTRAATASSEQGYRLQIGALRNAEAAKDELNRLRRTQADLLGSLDSRTSRFELVDQGPVWRVRVGPIADRGTAEMICDELKQRGAQCLLLAPPTPSASIPRQ